MTPLTICLPKLLAAVATLMTSNAGEPTALESKSRGESRGFSQGTSRPSPSANLVGLKEGHYAAMRSVDLFVSACRG